jgi:isopenicillin-N N-acyltransferase-like protein
MGFPVVFAGGGPRERGRTIGAAAKERVHGTVALYEQVFAHYAGLRWNEVRARVGAFVPFIDAYDVTLLPELEGIAEGAGLEAEDLLAANLRTEVMFGLDSRPGKAVLRECTAIGRGGPEPVVGQTWDWKPGTRDTVIVLACAPHDRPGFVSVVEAGLWAKCGINEEGVALATNALHASHDRGEPGVPFHAILRRAITGASLEESEEAIVRGPRASSANYLLGDDRGRVVDLETIPGGPAQVHRAERDALSHTNHFLWPSPRPFKDIGRIDGRDSVVRRARAEAVLAAGTAGVEDLRETFASHDDPDGPVCVHEDPNEPVPERYATIAGVIMQPAAGTIHVASGNPCEHPFETHGVAGLLAQARASV